MGLSETLAAIVGPTLAALGVSEAAHLRIWATPVPQVVYLNGALLLVAGVAIIRIHNVWVWGWPTAITVVGWLATAGGLYRMFAPGGPQAKPVPATYAMLALLAAVGAALAFIGWRH